MIDLNTIKITPEMVNIIGEIDEFKGAWRQIGRLTPDRLSSLKKVASIESIGSSTRIEGAKLTDREVEALLSRLGDHSFQSRDEQEVAGYAFACEQIFQQYELIPISENMIKQIHGWILQYSEKDHHHSGEYKKIPIRIEAFDSFGKSVATLFESTSPLETPIKMEELVIWTRNALEKKLLHPLIVIGLFAVLFLAIHPFQDGNGRISRILTTLLMMKAGNSYVIYSSMESIIEANKESYYLALQKTQTSWQKGQPDWSPWLLFFLKCLQRQKHHLEIKLSRETSMMKQLPELANKVISLLEAHGQLKIGEIQTLTNANRNTLKKTLSKLVEDKLISLNGHGKSSWYTFN